MQDEVALPVPIAFRSHGSFVSYRMWFQGELLIAVGISTIPGFARLTRGPLGAHTCAIMLTVISINLLGDGRRDALDPWLKGR